MNKNRGNVVERLRDEIEQDLEQDDDADEGPPADEVQQAVSQVFEQQYRFLQTTNVHNNTAEATVNNFAYVEEVERSISGTSETGTMATTSTHPSDSFRRFTRTSAAGAGALLLLFTALFTQGALPPALFGAVAVVLVVAGGAMFSTWLSLRNSDE